MVGAIIQSTEQPYTAARAATTLTVLAVLSPIAGMAVEMTLAWRFGASGTVDAFRIASLLLIFGNQLFIGQLLPNIIVPLFSELRAKGSEEEGWRLAFSLGGILGVVSLLFVSWVWFNPEALVDLLGPGLSGRGKADALLLVPYFSLVFALMVWSGVMSGVLQVYRTFWIPSVSQLITNLFVIISIFAVGAEWGSSSLALGVLSGALAASGLHLYFLIRIARVSIVRLGACLKLGPWDGVIKAARLSVPLVAMILMVQWGTIVINRVLSELPPGTLADFGYAWKLLLLMGILPTSLATIIFPALSDAQAGNSPAEFSRLVTRAIRMTLLLAIPVAAVLFVMRGPLISLMFARGAMSSGAVTETSQLFGVLLVGAPAGALMAILYKVAFSMQDTKSPAIAVFISTLVITWLVPYAAGVAGAMGVGWAYNTILWGSGLGLFAYQAWRFQVMDVWNIIRYLGHLAVLCIGIVLSAVVIRTLFELNTAAAESMTLVELSVITLISILVVYGLSQLLGISESSEIWNYCRWQLQRITLIKKIIPTGEK